MSNKITNNYINKNGFYLIDERSPSVIDILPWVQVKICVINTKKPLTFNLEQWSKLDFFGFFYDECPPKIFFHQNEDDTSLKISALFFNKHLSLTSQIKSYINANNCTSDIDVFWLIDQNKLSLDGVIEIEKNTQKIQAHLDMENIFISDEGSVSSIPTLLVRSDDIEASHSSTTHTIDEQHLFYLSSHGLEKNEAKFLLIQSYFVKAFEGLKDQKDLYNNIQEIFTSLQQ